MKNFIKILAVICIIAGCIVSRFSTIPAVDYSAITLEAFGFTVLIISTLKKAEKKTWKEYTCVALFAAAGICCGIAGIAEGTITQIITTVSALIALVIGLLAIRKKE